MNAHRTPGRPGKKSTQLMIQSIRSSFRAGAIGLSILFAPAAFAHPGHGTFDHGFVHAVTSPVHLALLASCGAALALSASLLRHPRARLALRCAGAGAVMLAGALWVI